MSILYGALIIAYVVGIVANSYNVFYGATVMMKGDYFGGAVVTIIPLILLVFLGVLIVMVFKGMKNLNGSLSRSERRKLSKVLEGTNPDERLIDNQ